MLSDQKGSIAEALPTGLAGALGPTGLLDGVADRLLGNGVSAAAQAGRATATQAPRTASVAARAPERTGSSLLRWIVGIAAALALLWAAYQFLNRSEPVREATQVGEPAQNLMVGDVDVGREVTGVFERATTALNDVSDAASAEAALPKLNEINDGLTKLGGLVDQLPGEGKSALAALVSASLANLEALIAKASGLPGVGEVIKPVADSILGKLRAMTA
jgi:hypothetical protein